MKKFMAETIQVYIDGACSGNPGPGGWGVLMRFAAEEKELAGYEDHTTNNRMELMAGIEALKALKFNRYEVEIYTDSRYLRDGLTLWMPKWKKNKWKTAKGDPVKNKDLWERLDALNSRFDVSWFWVKGHDGNPGNERADTLAKLALQKGVITKGV